MEIQEKDIIKDALKEEMHRIQDLWEFYFTEYQILEDKIKNPKNTNFKYVGIIIGNFIDTFDIIYGNRSINNFGDEYSGNMSLMQAIYVQQDFIQELLEIFGCGITKGDLKKDDNYNINRDIRNELMGHPIRKIDGELISTTLLAYNGPKNCISYARYHRDNEFAFEKISYQIDDIIARHSEFIKCYFAKILNVIKKLIKPFIKTLSQFQNAIEKIDFLKLLEFTSKHFESIHKSDYLYDKDSLKKVYEKRESHPRYQHLIDCFIIDLKDSIKGHLENIQSKFEPEEEILSAPEEPLFNILEDGTVELNITRSPNQINEKSFTYELGKLATNPHLFDMCYNIMKEGCSDNQRIVEELDFMAENQYNKIEYYCALRVIRSELEDKDELL